MHTHIRKPYVSMVLQLVRLRITLKCEFIYKQACTGLVGMLIHRYVCTVYELYITASNWRRYKTNFAALRCAWSALVLDSWPSTVGLWQLKISMQDEECSLRTTTSMHARCVPPAHWPLAINNKFDKRPFRNGSSCHKYKCLVKARLRLYRLGFRVNPTCSTRRNVWSSLAAAAGARVDLALTGARGGCLVVEPLMVLLEAGHDA